MTATVATDVFSVRFNSGSPLGDFALDSLYVERFWLPVLGPSSVLLARRLYFDLSFRPPGSVGDVDATLTYGFVDLAQSLGIKPAVLRHTLGRLVSFSLLTPGEPALLPLRWPPLRAGQVDRLPDALRAELAWWRQ